MYTTTTTETQNQRKQFAICFQYQGDTYLLLQKNLTGSPQPYGFVIINSQASVGHFLIESFEKNNSNTVIQQLKAFNLLRPFIISFDADSEKNVFDNLLNAYNYGGNANVLGIQNDESGLVLLGLKVKPNIQELKFADMQIQVERKLPNNGDNKNIQSSPYINPFNPNGKNLA